ncbi:MAG: ATP-binding cassette domain-containing protein [Deltaproteobacteria bacterium]|jgi:ABC-type lipoprotein export system ATPase subunit/glycosyltransferase involved in cell wall biosynthesis|nr:ATP-binding cassette domain-containing protein [Deltaproteobacteria bacterium]
MALVIDAQNLHKRYPGCPPVLRGASLQVEPGEMAAIMGPSGCGKSTMLHLLGLLHTPDGGILRMLDTDVTTLDREQSAFFRRRNLGFVMQSSNLFDFSTVYENVEFPLIYERTPFEERRERILRALELVHLTARVHYRSNRLSGGEQQRVAIARAMVNNPRILLADEPTGALDVRTSKSIMTSFRSLAHNGGVSMVVVTHDPSVAEYCDSVYTLDEGLLICRKKEAVPPPEGGEYARGMPVLPTPARMMNAVCVAGRIPLPNGVAMRQLLLRLYDDGVVSKIYSAYSSQNRSLDASLHIDLPAPVAHVGLLRAPLVVQAVLRHARDKSSRLWELWRMLPMTSRRRPGNALRRLWHFACGVLMARWCVEDGAEILHALEADGPATAAWVAGRLTGTPFSFAVRAADLAVPNPALPVKASDAAFICCDTEAALAALRASCPDLPPDRCILLRDGLVFPEGDVQSSLEELGLTDGAAPKGRFGISLLAVGVLKRRKGFDDLLRACALLRKEGIPFRCRIAGDGPAKWFLRLLARRHGLMGHVEFCGQTPHERIRHMMTEATIFVAPGVAGRGQDGLPTALIEAMQHALPVIVSDLAGQAEAVSHGVTGIITPQRSPQAIADAVNMLGSNPDKARSMGLAARRWALEHLDPERCGEEIIQRLLASRSVPPEQSQERP